MKKIYVKYKILVNGLPLKEYDIDGFTLKTSSFEKEFFKSTYNHEKQGIDLNMNCYLTSCLIDDENLTYSYFESNDYYEFEVSNKFEFKEYSIKKLFKSRSDILERVDDLEKKLRLVLNIPLLFQIICTEFYDENKKYFCTMQGNRHISFWNRLSYNLDMEELSNNCRFRVDFSSMKNTNNNHFNRALEFYDNSFESEKRASRYILVFSSLEAIFNLDSEDITEKLAKYSAKLLSEYSEEEYDEIYMKMKKLYDKRCDYVHGSKVDNILDEDEKLLRRYARKIIIAYWGIILSKKMTAKQVLKYLNSDEKLDIIIRMMIIALNSNDFSSQQHRLIELLEKDYNVVIPEETKKFILSNCDKKD